MRFSRLIPLWFAFTLLFAGCQSDNKRLGAISVSVVDLKPAGATLLEARAVLTLRFINENITPFGISGSTHKLYFNDTYVGTAVNNEPFGLPLLSTTTHDVTLLMENLALIQQVLALRDQQTVSYRLESVIFTTIGNDDLKLVTRNSGKLDLQSLRTTR